MVLTQDALAMTWNGKGCLNLAHSEWLNGRNKKRHDCTQM